MLLGNEEIREFNMYLFNDSILFLYIILCIYFIAVKSRPVVAAMFLTLALSIKAGAMLLVPSFLGWIQYQHGTFTLLKSILLIVIFQVIIMAPLSFDFVSRAVGFASGDTWWRDYLKYSKFLGGDKDRQYGSTYGNTIYWQIVGEKMYYE